MKGMRIILVLVYVLLIALLLLGLLFNCIGCTLPNLSNTDENREETGYVEADDVEDVRNIGGTGNLKVTLQWGFYADVDLHVVEPSGEEIYYQHGSSRTGGELDVDNIEGGPGSAENIFWENPPQGHYTVNLVYYAEKEDYPINQRQGICSVTIMQKDQEPRHYTIRLSPDNLSQTVKIADIVVP